MHFLFLLVCPVLDPVQNGYVIPETALEVGSPIGTMVQYICKMGFFPSSNNLESTCTNYVSGPAWSLQDLPACSLGTKQVIMNNAKSRMNQRG